MKAYENVSRLENPVHVTIPLTWNHIHICRFFIALICINDQCYFEVKIGYDLDSLR